MNIFFRKTILSTLPLYGVLRLFAIVAVLTLAAMPTANVAAAPAEEQTSNERLERVWARQLRLYERMGRRFEQADIFTARVQELIDRARSNGKDVSSVEAALEAFEAALEDAHPIYESIKGIVNSHQGFDENGKVIDPAKAQETVLSMREKFQEIKTAMNGTGKALHDAIRAFREANRPVQPTPSPTN